MSLYIDKLLFQNIYLFLCSKWTISIMLIWVIQSDFNNKLKKKKKIIIIIIIIKIKKKKKKKKNNNNNNNNKNKNKNKIKYSLIFPFFKLLIKI